MDESPMSKTKEISEIREHFRTKGVKNWLIKNISDVFFAQINLMYTF